MNGLIMDLIDKAFDDIVLGEEICQKEGYEDGVKFGERSGYSEGYQLGLQHGSKVGSELGFYLGLATAWKQLLSQSQNASQKRKQMTVDRLLELLESFPLLEPQHPEMQDLLEKIRAKYKQVSQLMHVQTNKDTHTQPLSF